MRDRDTWRGSMDRWRLGIGAVSFGSALLLLFVTWGPIAWLAGEAAVSYAEKGETVLALLAPGGRRLGLFAASLALAVLVAAFCTLVSWLNASFLWLKTRRRPAVYSYIVVLVWFMALLPPFVHTLVWGTFFEIFNQWLAAAGWREIRFDGYIASWWVQTMAWLPLSLGVALFGFQGIDPELVDAARVTGAPLAVLNKVVTPLVVPAIAAGGILVFLLSLLDFSIPSIFQVSTYALEIFADYSAYNDAARAFLLSLPLIVINAGALLLVALLLRHVSTVPPQLDRAWAADLLLPKWFGLLQYCAVALLLLQALLPLVSLLLALGSWRNGFVLVIGALEEIAFSAQTSVISAVLAVALSLGVALLKPEGLRRGLLVVVTATLALPASLCGIGLITLFNRPILDQLYQSQFMPVVAAVSRFGPLCLLIVSAQVSRTDRLLFDAARMLQTSRWQTFVKVRIPLLASGLLAGFMAVALLTMGELGATLLVTPPGHNTVAIKAYNLLHYGASQQVAGLCLLLVLSGWVFGLIGIRIMRNWRRNAR